MDLEKRADYLLKINHQVRDPYEGLIKRSLHVDVQRHCRRVSSIASSLADIHGLDKNRIHLVKVAGLMHDIGKVVTPPEIIVAPRKLTKDEGSIIARHPVDSGRFCQENDFPYQVFEAARHHHERFVGGGYPDNLRDREVTLNANLIALADVFDALTEKRPYKEGWSRERAFNYIDERFGVIFLPELRPTFYDWYGIDTAPLSVPVERRLWLNYSS